MGLYAEKEKWLQQFPEVKFSEFYRDIFPAGSFEKEAGKMDDYERTGKGNGFIVYEMEDGRKHTRMVFDDLSEIGKQLDKKSAFMSCISYFGKNRTAANAREMFALVFDLDDVGGEEIQLFWDGWVEFYGERGGRAPRPTYIVNSGGGVHLYYVFEIPVPLYPNIQRELKELKYKLTELIWNGDTSRLEQRQFQGINQGFRLVGSRTKRGETVKAYLTGGRVSLEYLSQFVPEEFRIKDTFYHSCTTLAEAKKKWPEWYHQRIELGRKRKGWTCNRALYDWWKGKWQLAQVHHRYFYIMALAIYALKSGVSLEELKKDAEEIRPGLNRRDNPFTEDDVASALELYQECFRTFPRKDIEKLTAIEIPANKRNGRPQKLHLKMARAVRDVLQEEKGKKWYGRPSVRQEVEDFITNYPAATYKDFVECTGLKKSVWYKYKREFRGSQTLGAGERSGVDEAPQRGRGGGKAARRGRQP